MLSGRFDFGVGASFFFPPSVVLREFRQESWRCKSCTTVTSSFSRKCVRFSFFFCLLCGVFFRGFRHQKFGRPTDRTSGRRGCITTHLLPWIGSDFSGFPFLVLFFFFFLSPPLSTFRLSGICVFDFAFNLVWLAVNGAWLVWGINDMTRDTPLLEFSQVRATPIDGTPLPLCLPSGWMKGFLSLPLFVVLSTYQRKRDGHKRAY